MAAVGVFRSANGTILDEDNKKVKKYLKMVAVNLGAVRCKRRRENCVTFSCNYRVFCAYDLALFIRIQK